MIAEWATKRTAPFWKTKRPAINEQLLNAMLSQFIAARCSHDKQLMVVHLILLSPDVPGVSEAVHVEGVFGRSQPRQQYEVSSRAS
jgi:hypothetical protein